VNVRGGPPNTAFRATDISVIIPTLGRSTLIEAVRSVLAQSELPGEVIVVQDSSVGHPPALPESPVVMLTRASRPGQTGAWTHGLSVSSGCIIALLDDDDVWYPHKIRTLLSVLADTDTGAAGAPLWLFSSALRNVTATSGDEWPRDGSSPTTPLLTYLFARDTFRTRQRHLQSSTLAFPRQLAEICPFKGGLDIHTDWAWLRDIDASGIPLSMLWSSSPLVEYRTASERGAPAVPRWKRSLAWAQANLDIYPPNVRRDFGLAVPTMFAAQVGDARAWVGCVAWSLRQARLNRYSAPMLIKSVSALIQQLIRRRRRPR
jgi:hypothetical protein